MDSTSLNDVKSDHNQAGSGEYSLKSAPRVSVVIPTYNDAAVLVLCLNALMEQSLPTDQYEVIVVDDGSTDNTKDLVTSYMGRGPKVSYFYQKNQGPATARNYGAQMATGDVVMFTDADCEPTHDWLEQMLKPFIDSNMEIKGVKGAYRTRQKTFTAQFAQIEFMYRYRKMLRSEYVDFVDTYAAAFDRDVFLSLNGFDTSFPVANNEDVEFSYRMAEAGHKMVFNPEAIVYHQHPDTLYKYLRLKFGRAYWRMAVYEKFPDKIKSDSYTPQSLKIQIVLANLFLLNILFFSIQSEYREYFFATTATLFVLSTLPFLLTVIDSQAIFQIIGKILKFFKRGFIRACIEKIKLILAESFLRSIFYMLRDVKNILIAALRDAVLFLIYHRVVAGFFKGVKQAMRSIWAGMSLLSELIVKSLASVLGVCKWILDMTIMCAQRIFRSSFVQFFNNILQRICCTKVAMIPISVVIIFLQGLVMGLGIVWGLQPRRATKSRFTQFILFFLSDAIALYSAISLTYYLDKYLVPSDVATLGVAAVQFEAIPLLVMILLVSYMLLGLYKPSSGLTRVKEFMVLVKATVTLALVACGLLYYADIAYSYSMMGLLVLLLIIFVNTGRAFVRHFYNKYAAGTGEEAPTRILIVGTKELAHLICRKLESIKCVDSSVVGFVSVEDGEVGKEILGHKVLGSADDLGRVINDYNVHEVFVALPLMPQKDVLTLIDEHSGKEGVHFHIITNMFDLISAEINIAEQKNIPIAYLKNEPLRLVQRLAKRCFDVFVSLLIMLVSFPLWLFIIIAIKVETDGPAFFRQERVGKNGKVFKIFKFRTMYVDTDKYQLSPTEAGDSRVTRVGSFLRKASLDELPQFINILKGEMSLVGPRPEMPFIVEKYEPWEWRRLTIKPGLTGLWQIMGRKDLPLHENLEYDFYYIKNQSLLLDLIILVKTVPLVLLGKGAY